jgi:hypothetical protein
MTRVKKTWQEGFSLFQKKVQSDAYANLFLVAFDSSLLRSFSTPSSSAFMVVIHSASPQ